MNRFSMLSSVPKGTRKVASPGASSKVAQPGVRKPRSAAPKSTSTRMYGKVDQQPSVGSNMLGGPDDLYR